MVGKYKVITLCGSTRFKDAFMAVQKRLTLEGNIVISVGLFGHSGDNEVWEGMSEDTLTATKKMLDDMHKRKIDMADEIFVINVGGYIGDSTKSEIEYAKANGKPVRYLENEADCFIPEVDIGGAFTKLKKRQKDLLRYSEIMTLAKSPDNAEFQKKYDSFYRVRRSEEWRAEYFFLMDTTPKRGNTSFGEILLRLHLATGQIEPSFTSKMLATLDPDMPIWDSHVLKALKLRLSGKTPEMKFSTAVVIYDQICRWYHSFLQTQNAKDIIRRFDMEFPEFQAFSSTKKIDFVLWASQQQEGR